MMRAVMVVAPGANAETSPVPDTDATFVFDEAQLMAWVEPAFVESCAVVPTAIATELGEMVNADESVREVTPPMPAMLASSRVSQPTVAAITSPSTTTGCIRMSVRMEGFVPLREWLRDLAGRQATLQTGRVRAEARRRTAKNCKRDIRARL